MNTDTAARDSGRASAPSNRSPSLFKDAVKAISQELLVERLANENNLGDLLLSRRPFASVVLVADIHDGVEDMLEGVVLHCEDALDPEDQTPLLGQLPQGLHPLAQLLWQDLPLTDYGHGVHTAIMPALLDDVAVAVYVASTVAGAVTGAVAAAVASTVAVLLLAVRIMAAPMAAPMAAVALFVAAAMAVLLRHHGLLLDVGVHEVRHVVRPDVRELRHLHATAHSRKDLGEGVHRP
mmetsp:Transcript_68523/g.200450  ORF Transcript_68523/g.200450 Transcript_68523/m.200450 type:complete len:237 (+) Transcript_68523:2-712(+)